MEPKLYELSFDYIIGEESIRACNIFVFKSRRQAESAGRQIEVATQAQGYGCFFLGAEYLKERPYAQTYWTIEDVLYRGEDNGKRIRRNEAKEIIRFAEKHIVEAMVSGGWDVIDYALDHSPHES